MKKLILFSSFFALVSCSTQLYIPIQSAADVSLEDLVKGRDLYVKNCASCHHLYSPNKFDAKKWELTLKDMQEEAEISDADTKLIYHYLVNAPAKQ